MSNLQIKTHTNSDNQHHFLPSSMSWNSMDDFFNRFMTHWPFHSATESVKSESDVRINPQVDVREDKSAYQISAELPGLDVKGVNLDLSDGILTLSGEKKFEREEDKDNSYHIMERRYGFFKRSFVLPPSVEQDKIKADFNQGILHIVLPKSEKARQKQRNISIDS